MPSGSGTPAKLPVRWNSRARTSLNNSLHHIGAQDPGTSILIQQRVSAALDAIAIQPGIGTPTQRRNTRRFPIAKTGHAIEYTVVGGEIIITRWVRQVRVRKI